MDVNSIVSDACLVRQLEGGKCGFDLAFCMNLLLTETEYPTAALR